MRRVILVLSVLLPVASGCDESSSAPDPFGQYNSIKFVDSAQTNTELDVTSADVAFHDLDGNEVTLDQYQGKKNVLLVITRGSRSSYLCARCTAQTSRLIRNYDEFETRNTEVLVVYPGPTGTLSSFKATALNVSGKKELPFSILLDEELTAIQKLSLEADLAKPSTFIIDRDGKLRFAYVGATVTDRPSLKVILEQLDLIQSESQAGIPHRRSDQPREPLAS